MHSLLSPQRSIPMAALLLSAALSAQAATSTVFQENFDSYTGAATNLTDMSDADVVSPLFIYTDDLATNGVAGAGVQLVNWSSHSGPNAMLLRSHTELNLSLTNALSGSKYQFDFWLNASKGTGDRNWFVSLRGMGTDNNGSDFVAYRSDRAVGNAIFFYEGLLPGTGWKNTGATHIENQWQHHRIIVDSATQQIQVFIDDMTTPVASGDMARVDVPVPTQLRLFHEGNSPDDGYFLVDDITLTVDGSINLSSVFTEGFESYSARTGPDDDADPTAPWVISESDGVNDARAVAMSKVQIVDSSVVPAHSGSKSLLLQGGQRAGATIAWGVPPQQDVQITWWARVPASVDGQQATYLRFSLYGAENGNTYAGDNALLGYGSRDANIGDETSLTYYTTAWVDTQVNFTPDVWEEYRLETHSNQGRYSIWKNPSSANPITVVDQAAFIGTASTWTPFFMAAWSSSNGTNHPPVYVDDITIKSLVSVQPALPLQYNVNLLTDRFTNYTVLTITNSPVGKAIFDPRDNSTVIFAIDSAPGGIYRATKTASGNWTVDPTPIVANLDRPSGLDIAADGTLWWSHDFGGQVMRLKAPWSSNVPEVVIANFGSTTATDPDDDPIDLVVAPQSFTGSIGKPGSIVVADRGLDGNDHNTLFVIDPSTTETNVTGYTNYLVYYDPAQFVPLLSGSAAPNLNAIAALPASGEVVALTQDGWISAVDGNGTVRQIWPATLWLAGTGAPSPAGNSIAVDPKTGRIWVMDDTLEEVWSVDATTAADRKELSFPIINTNRMDRQLDNNDPGMAFSKNGDYLAMTDTSTANGGGRILIFHNEAIVNVNPFKVTSIKRTGQGVELIWQSAGAGSYRVQRSTNLSGNNFQDISGVLTGTSFTDTNAPADAAFYRVVLQP